VRIHVHRETGAGVTDALADNLRIDSVLEELRDVCMAQRVEVRAREFAPLQ